MAYDTMGRPSSLTDTIDSKNWVSGVQYDFAGRMTNLTYLTGNPSSTSTVAETLGYNATTGQLASMAWSGAGISGGLTYTYSGTQNNGQITQVTDTISGETISYQYDALKRLTCASSAGSSCPATPGTGWTQTYQYDGFGNLTAKVLNGTSSPMTVNAATNQLSSAYYDANGYMTSGAGASLAYDDANRMSESATISGGLEYYGYDESNKRVYRATGSILYGGVQEELTFYGAYGEKLGVYSVQYGGCTYTYLCISGQTATGTSIWFAGRLVTDGNNTVAQDRLGTNRVSGARFYPYGDEITSTSNDRVKFATYTRDSYTGLDYADQRFYASTYGRFNTPDPSSANVDDHNPTTWNAYSYTNGDPINSNDPSGLAAGVPCGSVPVAGTNETLAQEVNANTPQGHFIDLVWHEAGSLSQAGGNVADWTAEFEGIAQAIGDRYELVSGDVAVTGANGTVYSAAAGNISQLGYGGYGTSLNQVLINAANGTNPPVLNSQGQLLLNTAELQSDLNEAQTFQYAKGDLELSNGTWVTPDCYSVLAAMEFANGVTAGIDYNPTGVFVTSWNSSAPVNNPNYAAGVEQLLGSAGPTNFYGFTGSTFGTYVPPVRRPHPPQRRPKGPR